MTETNLFIVRYDGLFAFMKPFSAVRDERTMSSFYVPPTVIEGIEGHLFGNSMGRIVRSRLSFSGVSYQREMTQTAGWNRSGGAQYMRNRSTLTRGVLLYPQLILAFLDYESAVQAMSGWVMLSRREDILMPTGEPQLLSLTAFDLLPGYECIARSGNEPGAVPMGYYADGQTRYVRLVGQLSPARMSVQDTYQDLAWL